MIYYVRIYEQFIMQPITPTREDYIREILLISSKQDFVRMIDICKKLNLARSTVSERMKSLQTAGLIKLDDERGITLTKKGNNIAKKLTYKHRLIEVFLHDVLGIPTKNVHNEAHKLEHAMSDVVISKLNKFLKNPTKDPHGNKITKV